MMDMYMCWKVVHSSLQFRWCDRIYLLAIMSLVRFLKSPTFCLLSYNSKEVFIFPTFFLHSILLLLFPVISCYGNYSWSCCHHFWNRQRAGDVWFVFCLRGGVPSSQQHDHIPSVREGWHLFKVLDVRLWMTSRKSSSVLTLVASKCGLVMWFIKWWPWKWYVEWIASSRAYLSSNSSFHLGLPATSSPFLLVVRGIVLFRTVRHQRTGRKNGYGSIGSYLVESPVEQTNFSTSLLSYFVTTKPLLISWRLFK